MSICGWYEYYVVDEASKQVSLAMQFHKRGSATPDNAAAELRTLEELTHELDGTIPIRLVRKLLEDNLGGAVDLLPPSFALGYYYFLLQRAAEHVHNLCWRPRYDDLPREQRPHHQLAHAIRARETESGVTIPSYDDPVIDRAHFSIKVGLLLRRWPECSTRMTFLRWLQYLTQISDDNEGGSRAGPYRNPREGTSVYRFLFHVPTLRVAEQPVTSIGLQLRSVDDRPLLNVLKEEIEEAEDDEERQNLMEEYETIRTCLEELRYEPESLEDVLQTHAMKPSAFWECRLPRNDYLGP